MARVTGKYNVDFNRGESAFDNLLGQYLGTREKRSEERYQRELKDADPKAKLAWVYKLKQEQRNMHGELAKLLASLNRSSGSGVSWSTTEKGADNVAWAKQMEEYRDEHFKDAGQLRAGMKQAKSSDVDSWVQAPDDFKTSFMKSMETANMSEMEKVGFGIAVVKMAKERGKGDLALNVVNGAGVGPNARTNELYDKATDRMQDFSVEGPSINLLKRSVLMGLKTPTQQRRTSGKGSRGSALPDNKGLIAFYTKQIQDLDVEIKNAQDDYEGAKAGYSDLIRGPSYNRALSPTSIKPSPVGHIIDSFRRLHEVDPTFARDVLTVSDEEGEFTVPDPYAGLVDIEGAGGQSPLNVIVDATDMLRKIRGLGLKEGEGSIEPRTLNPLTAEDADLVEDSLSQMLSALESPLYEDDSYDGARDILERSKNMFRFAGGNESRRIQASEILADSMDGWEGSLNQDDLIKMSKKDQPEFRVADSIRQSQVAYDKFLKTRNAEEYRTDIAKTYNDLIKTTPEVRGLVGDAALGEIERYESADPSERLPEQLNFKLQGLLQSADVIGARGVMEPGYEGELPEIGDRTSTGSVGSTESEANRGV